MILWIILLFILFICINCSINEPFMISSDNLCNNKPDGSNCKYVFTNNNDVEGPLSGYFIQGTCYYKECKPSISLMVNEDQGTISGININGGPESSILESIRNSIKCRIRNDIKKLINEGCNKNNMFIHKVNRDSESNIYELCSLNTMHSESTINECNPHEFYDVNSLLSCKKNVHDTCSIHYNNNDINCNNNINLTDDEYIFDSNGIGDPLCRKGDTYRRCIRNDINTNNLNCTCNNDEEEIRIEINDDICKDVDIQCNQDGSCYNSDRVTQLEDVYNSIDNYDHIDLIKLYNFYNRGVEDIESIINQFNYFDDEIRYALNNSVRNKYSGDIPTPINMNEYYINNTRKPPPSIIIDKHLMEKENIKLINDRYKEELDRYCGDNIDCTDILDQRFNEICIKNNCVLCDNILNQRNITKGTCPSKLNHNEKCTPLANSGYIVDPQNSNIKCNYGKLTFPKIIKMDSIL